MNRLRVQALPKTQASLSETEQQRKKATDKCTSLEVIQTTISQSNYNNYNENCYKIIK
jgi:hypothetical protein